MYGNRQAWDASAPPVPCPRGCGHHVHWNPCETAETAKIGEDKPSPEPPAKPQPHQEA